MSCGPSSWSKLQEMPVELVPPPPEDLVPCESQPVNRYLPAPRLSNHGVKPTSASVNQLMSSRALLVVSSASSASASDAPAERYTHRFGRHVAEPPKPLLG